MKFAMTAKAMARQQADGVSMDQETLLNMHKVTRFRQNGEEELQAEIEKLTIAQEIESENMQKAFDDDGTQYEWARAHKKAGPGYLKKKRIESGMPGSDPVDLLDKAGKGRKSVNMIF